MMWSSQLLPLSGKKRPRSDYLGQMNFALGQVRIGGQWLVSEIYISLSRPWSLNQNVSLINNNLQSKVCTCLSSDCHNGHHVGKEAFSRGPVKTELY